MSDTPPSSVQNLTREIEENPHNIRALSELAQWYANQSDYASACQHYEKIVRSDEDNVKAWTALGHCYLLKGEYQNCFDAYQQALQASADNKDPQLWYGVALLYNRFENYDHAKPAFQKVLALEPDFEQKHEVLYRLGLIYKDAEDFDTSLEYLQSSLTCSDVALARKIETLCHIGDCCRKQANLFEALEYYKQALELEDTNFKTLECLGWAHYLAQEFDTALRLFTRALDCVQGNCAEAGDLHYLIGRCHSAQRAYTEGQVAMQRAIYKNPNAYIYWCSIGILYALAIQAQDAFDCLVKASNIRPKCGLVWFNMGVLYELCGQRQEAILAYQRSHTLDHTKKSALKRKEELQMGASLEERPHFVHPTLEISDIPFSIATQGVVATPEVQLPDINQWNSGNLRAALAKPKPSLEAREQMQKPPTFMTQPKPMQKEAPTPVSSQAAPQYMPNRQETNSQMPYVEAKMMHPYQVMMNPMMWMVAMNQMAGMMHPFNAETPQSRADADLRAKRSQEAADAALRKKRK